MAALSCGSALSMRGLNFYLVSEENIFIKAVKFLLCRRLSVRGLIFSVEHEREKRIILALFDHWDSERAILPKIFRPLCPKMSSGIVGR